MEEWNESLVFFKTMDQKFSNIQWTQLEINIQQRSALVDWVYDCIRALEDCGKRTFFLTCHILDRYLELKQVTLDQFQLVGVACLWIATKIEGVGGGYLLVTDLINCFVDDIKKEQILAMECEILQSLDFQLLYTTTFDFLRCYVLFFPMNQADYNELCYLCELCELNFNLRIGTRLELFGVMLMIQSHYRQSQLYWKKEQEDFFYPFSREDMAKQVDFFKDKLKRLVQSKLVYVKKNYREMDKKQFHSFDQFLTHE